MNRLDVFDINAAEELADFGKRMCGALLKFKNAVEQWWKIMESYGVTLEKLNEVSAAIDAGSMTRREGWIALGLPIAEAPGLSLKERVDNYNAEADRRITELFERDRKELD